jgi:Uma2 family endonuclease
MYPSFARFRLALLSGILLAHGGCFLVGYEGLSGTQKRERLPRPGKVRPIELRPDWVCEISSPSTAARDRVTKRHLYARAEILHYWLIDPEARVLEALCLRDGSWFEMGVYDDTAVARIAPFEAVELELGRLFLPREADE